MVSALFKQPANVMVSFEESPVLRDEWNRLLARAATNTVFSTYEWQSTWWRHFGASEKCQLCLLTLRDPEGALIGIAPLFIANEPLAPLQSYAPGRQRPAGRGQTRRLVMLVGGVEVADYLDVVAAPPDLPALWSSVFHFLSEHRDEWDVIDFHSLPESSPSREIIRDLAHAYGLASELIQEDVSPKIDLPGDWNTYLMGLRKKDRHELRRKVRKLEGRSDTRWYLVPVNEADKLERGVAIFTELMRKSGVDKASFMTPVMASYFMDLARSLAPRGWVELAIMEIDDKPAAAYYSFVYDGRVYLYNSGYDPRWAGYSAGLALLAYRIHKAINQGLKVFDLLRGDEDYKYDFGAKNTYVYRAVLTANHNGK